MRYINEILKSVGRKLVAPQGLKGLLNTLRRRRVAQGPFLRHFEQPPSRSGPAPTPAAGAGAPGQADPPIPGTTPVRPVTPQQTLNAAFPGQEREFIGMTIRDIDPNTMRVLMQSDEHLTLGGELVHDKVIGKVRDGMRKVVNAEDIKGQCAECLGFVADLYSCVLCSKSLCKAHAVVIRSQAPKDGPVTLCQSCVAQIEFNRDAWQEFDNQRGL